MNYKHGMRGTREYGVWRGMLTRCNNKNCKAYKNYGGRGIKVCDRWAASFADFIEDMGPCPDGHSIERIDNNSGYNPDNCRWATRADQSKNRRNTRTLTVDGVTRSMGEWSELSGISIKTIWFRIAKGWTEKEAVMIPKVTRRAGIARGEKLRNYA